MRVANLICLTAVMASGLAACASDGGSRYGYRGDRYSSETRCERDRSNNRAAATVAGAAIGAVAGSAIAGNSSNTAGTVAGGVAGAIVGNQLAKGDPCPADYRR
ncbi:MAG: glycine zipper 2TM domain-containing protein [Phenylobacterium sp.]